MIIEAFTYGMTRARPGGSDTVEIHGRLEGDEKPADVAAKAQQACDEMLSAGHESSIRALLRDVLSDPAKRRALEKFLGEQK